MFWLAFISIILFIIFLIFVLVTTTQTSTGMTLRSSKEEQKRKPEKPRKEPKAEERPAAITEDLPVVEEEITAVEEEASKTDEAIEAQEETAEKVEETFIAETVPPAIDEAVEEEISEAVDDLFIHEEEPFIIEEDKTVFEKESAVEAEPVQERLEVAVEPEKTAPEAGEPEVEEVPVVEDLRVEVEPEEVAYNYPVFDNTRTMEEFGLSKEDADDFAVDLIKQVEVEIPGLEEAVSTQDNKKIEEVSHMIKGSATNLGTGGIADVLVDFNTYMKTANDPSVIAGHMRNLRRALKELKEQFQ